MYIHILLEILVDSWQSKTKFLLTIVNVIVIAGNEDAMELV